MTSSATSRRGSRLRLVLLCVVSVCWGEPATAQRRRPQSRPQQAYSQPAQNPQGRPANNRPPNGRPPVTNQAPAPNEPPAPGPAAPTTAAVPQPLPQDASANALAELPAETEPSAAEQLSMADVVAEKTSALEAAADDAELLERLTTEYQTAIAKLNQRDDFARREIDHRRATAELSQKEAAIRSELEGPLQDDGSSSVPLPSTLDELVAERARRQRRVDELSREREAIGTIESALGDRANAASRLSTIEGQLREAEASLAGEPPAGESPLLTQARKTRIRATMEALLAERPAKQAVIEFIDARSKSNLLALQRDLSTKKLQFAQAALREAELAEQRKRSAVDAEALTQAREAENTVDPQLRELAKTNRQLLESKNELAQQIRDAQTERSHIAKTLEAIKLRFNTTKEREQLLAGRPTWGAVLRKHRMDLRNPRTERQANFERQQRVVAAQQRIIDHDEDRKQLTDVDRQAEEYVANLPGIAEQSQEYQDRLIAGAAKQLTERRQILDELRSEQSTLFNTLTDTSVDHEQLIKLTKEFAEYIDQRVLWIRSADPMSFDLRSDQSLHWTKPEPWKAILEVLIRDIQAHWARYGAAVLIFAMLSIASVRSGSVLAKLAEESRRSTCRRFLPTARATLIAAVTAFRNVFPLIFVAWRLRSAEAEENSIALAAALTVAARVALPLEFFRQVVRRDGLADAHFGWSERTIILLRRHLRWLSPLGSLCVATAVLLASDDGARGPINIERLFFVVAAGLVCLFALRVAHPQRGVPAQFLSEYPDGWFSRLRSVWFTLLVVVPLGIAVLSAIGYVYTANQLAWRSFASVVVLAAVALAFSLAARALLISRRAACIDQARQRYRAEAEAAAAAGSDDAGTDPLIAEVAMAQDPLADLRTQTAQARRLLAACFTGAAFVGLWFTWRDILPAVSDKWVLWKSMRGDVTDPVTLFELMVAIAVFSLSLVAARDLPGMAEITVLNKLPLDKSVRYAITTLVSYGIVLAGLVFACQTVGLRWSQIQWMATALTFGLAFGLQEMFANFVAGIIILFERPVRVGDIVTLGDVTGVVSKVKIRATTITNWDRKDYIVPNKDFITGRVLNWTLSDHVNRILVKVGIAYGSDTQLAKQLITGIAKNHPVVVDDPEPMVTFESFGDSSLDFALRCYISMKDMPMRLQVVDDLHTTIDNEFRKAGIEIAFPQRDLHVRHLPEQLIPPQQRPSEQAND